MYRVINFLTLLLPLLILGACSSPRIITPLSDVINVLNFGAIPDDGKDDSEAIQKAIDFAIKGKGAGRVYLPPGVYDLNKGLVIANANDQGNLTFVTLTLSGHQSAYTTDQRIGKTTVLRLKSPIFAVALQLARNCVIENLVIEGSAKYSTDIVKIATMSKNEWGKPSGASDNRYSPSCGIVIDPFNAKVPVADRYKGFDNFYNYSGNGGSSMVLIRGCSFRNHYIAIANNPSNGNQNGDNIRAEQCHVTTCHTFWSAGQTQSRANSIDNIYALYLHTLVSGVQIGAQNGTPPSVSNVNMAGFCKMAFDISTGFSGLNVYRSYFESLYSLGISNGLSTSFDQCQFKFYKPDAVLYAPPFHLYSDRVVAIRDCSIEYFDNCNTPAPFLFRAKELLVSGGSVEGGVITADGITNAGGDDLHKVNLEAVFIKCLGAVAGKQTSMKPESKVKDEIIMGGEVIVTTEGEVVINRSTTYDVTYVESITPQIDISSKSLSFETSKSGMYTVGDNLFTGTSINTSKSGMGNYTMRSYLGYVSSVQGKKITVKGIPWGLENIKQDVYKVAYPIVKRAGQKNSSDKVVKYRKI